MKKILSVVYAVLMSLGILAGLWALTLHNPHFGPTADANLLRRGRAAASEGDYAAAIESYRLIIFRNPRHTDAYLSLADAFVLSDDPEGALPFLRRGLKTRENAKLRDAYEKLLVVAGAESG